MGALAIESGSTTDVLLDETIGQNLARTVAEHGDGEALVSCHQGIRWTYREFAERVASLAQGLMAAGLEKGDRVGIWSPNYAEWTLVQYATAEIGVILVNINPAYRTHELAYALHHSGCRMLIAAPAFKTSDYLAMVDEVRADCPELETAVFFWDPRMGRARRRRCPRPMPNSPSAGPRWRPTTRSTSSTRRAPPGSRRAPRSRTATS